MTPREDPLAYAEFEARVHRHFCRDANRCITLGVAERTGELPDPSLAERAAAVAEAEELLERAPLGPRLGAASAQDPNAPATEAKP